MRGVFCNEIKMMLITVVMLITITRAAGDSPAGVTCIPEPSTRTPLSDGTVGSWNCTNGWEMARLTANSTDGAFCNETFIDKDYIAACDANDPTSCNDAFARKIHGYFNQSLSVYSCDEYSRLWTCADCEKAYRRWLCAIVFKKCLKQEGGDLCGGSCLTTNDLQNGRALPACVMKTCQDVCYDVVRKCPVHLGFSCPPTNDEREYSSTSSPVDCNLPAPCLSSLYCLSKPGAAASSRPSFLLNLLLLVVAIVVVVGGLVET